MTVWTWLWLIWLAFFLVIEGFALFRVLIQGFG